MNKINVNNVLKYLQYSYNKLKKQSIKGFESK